MGWSRSQPGAPRETGLVGGIALAVVVLVVHIGLISLMTAFVMTLGSLFEYRLFIFLVAVGLAGFGGYAIYRRFDVHVRQVLTVLRDPAVRGRSLEVSFLGGVALLRVGRSEDERMALEAPHARAAIEAPDSARVRDLASLSELLVRGHVTEEEFAGLKQGLLGQAAVRPAVDVTPAGAWRAVAPAPPRAEPFAAQPAPAARPAIFPAKAPQAPAQRPSPVKSALKGVAGWAWRKLNPQ